HILNFAHGSFFMLGAYIAFTASTLGIPYLDISTFGGYLVASLVAAGAIGLLGIVVDLVVLRRLRDVDDAYSLIATFGLLLVCDGTVRWIWGVQYYSVPPPEGLGSAFRIGSLFIPQFSLFVTATGIVVFILLEIGIHRMWIGKLV